MCLTCYLPHIVIHEAALGSCEPYEGIKIVVVARLKDILDLALQGIVCELQDFLRRIQRSERDAFVFSGFYVTVCCHGRFFSMGAVC